MEGASGARPDLGGRPGFRKVVLMRKLMLMVFGALLALPLAVQAQQQQSVADAARKAKAQKKTTPPAKKVYNEDNLPASANATEVGEKGATGETVTPAGGEAAGTGADKGAEEAAWRKRFAEQRGKIAAAEKELDILQRELNLLSVQYYSDPNKALKEQTDRTEIS